MKSEISRAQLNALLGVDVTHVERVPTTFAVHGTEPGAFHWVIDADEPIDQLKLEVKISQLR